MPSTGPVFIVGCGRSGTTLLFQLLRRHPLLTPTAGYPDGEDHVGWNTHGACRISGLGHADRDRGHTGYCYCLYMDEQDVTDDIAHGMRRYYAQEVLGGRRDRRVLNKCPHLSNKLRYLCAIFPDARIVHIVRDCLPVVASWIEIMRDQPGQVLYLPPTPMPCFWVLPAPESGERERIFRHENACYPGGDGMALVDYWRLVNRNVKPQMTERSSQLLTVRYEDLCATPGVELARIFEFCGLAQHAVDTRDDYGRDVAATNEKHLNRLDESFVTKALVRAADVRAEFGYA